MKHLSLISRKPEFAQTGLQVKTEFVVNLVQSSMNVGGELLDHILYMGSELPLMVASSKILPLKAAARGE